MASWQVDKLVSWQEGARVSKALSFEGWVAQVPESLERDPLWNFQVYPKALHLYDLAWEDCEYPAERSTRARCGQSTYSQCWLHLRQH